jgi:uncharacterized protein YodC (DUF2158 family)
MAGCRDSIVPSHDTSRHAVEHCGTFGFSNLLLFHNGTRILKLGDTVKPVGGGPAMTITAVMSDGRFWCVEFSEVEGVVRPTGRPFKAEDLKPTCDRPPVFRRS